MEGHSAYHSRTYIINDIYSFILSKYSLSTYYVSSTKLGFGKVIYTRQILFLSLGACILDFSVIKSWEQAQIEFLKKQKNKCALLRRQKAVSKIRKGTHSTILPEAISVNRL